MDKETKKGIENLESSVTAADLPNTPEGVREFVDLIGDTEQASSVSRTDTEE